MWCGVHPRDRDPPVARAEQDGGVLRFADGREKRQHREGPEVVGDGKALGVLFSSGFPMQVQAPKPDRKARRKELAKTWSRMVMARLPHLLVTARAADSKHTRKSVAKRLANRPAPKFAPQPTLTDMIRRNVGRDRRAMKRAIRRAGYRWKAVARRWRVRRGAERRRDAK